MIYPMTTEPADINSTLIRIADQHNSDIDAMQAEEDRMKAQVDSIRDRFSAYQDRWDRYQDSYREILHSFYAMNGNLTVEEMRKHLSWNRSIYGD